MGNICYHSVPISLSSLMLYMNMKNKIYETILPVVGGCDNWPFTIRRDNV
jgi:hypothetical protein